MRKIQLRRKKMETTNTTINQEETNKDKLEKIAKELIKVAEENEITLTEFDQATYRVRQYYNENAVLKSSK